MASAYGANRNIACPGCKLGYDAFRTGMSFTEVRRTIIAIGTDRKTGKTKYGRRSGVLGYHHEIKKMLWEQHIGDCMSSIEWRPVIGASRYEVSNHGEVRSLVGRNGKVRDEPLVMHPGALPRSGHLFVLLVHDGEAHKRNRYVHHLVLEAFVGPRPEGAMCRHLDGNPSRNVVGNLAWGTYAENMADSIAHGTRAKGERHGMAKLTEQLVSEIRASKERGSVIAKRLGISGATVSMIRNGKLWKEVQA